MEFIMSIQNMFEYLQASHSSRCINEGQAVLNAGHLILYGAKTLTDSFVEVYALCLKSSALKEAPHKIEGILLLKDTEVFVKKIICSCKAGNSSRCKHIAAFLFICTRTKVTTFKMLSSTDIDCYWKKEKSNVLEHYNPQPISTSACIKKNETIGDPELFKFNLTTDQKKSVLEKFIKIAPSSAISLHKNRKRQLVIPTIIPVIPEDHQELTIVINNMKESIFKHIENFNISRHCCQHVFSKLKISSTLDLCLKTKNKLIWKYERKYRITGSKCYEIFTYNKDDWTQKATKFFWPKGFTNKFVQHGIAKEDEARTLYAEMWGHKVIQTGLIVDDRHPWLGYTPDGIIMDEQGVLIKLLEIKCPFSGKDQPLEEIISNLNYLKNENGIELKKNHKYYGQIQLGMAILNIKSCDFVIYASHDKKLLQIEVPFNETFAIEMVKNIQNKYFNFMLHEICVQE